MDAHLLALHPTDQTLGAYGLGKLDDGWAEAVNQHLEVHSQRNLIGPERISVGRRQYPGCEGRLKHCDKPGGDDPA